MRDCYIGSKLLRNRIVAFAYLEFGRIDGQNAGSLQHKSPKNLKFSESVILLAYFATVSVREPDFEDLTVAKRLEFRLTKELASDIDCEYFDLSSDEN